MTTLPDEAAEYIKRGGIVAFPTETVYGLGANVFDEAAVAEIFEAKRRPADNPLIAHIADLDQIRDLATEVTEGAQKLIHIYFPGPLTVVLKKSARVPLIATAGLDTIGIRMPGLELARRFLNACGSPVVAPSANLSGRPSPTTWQAVAEDLDGRIDCILQGDATEIGLESTVVDCTGDGPVVLRTGSITLQEIRDAVGSLGDIAETERPRSPGLKHRHYSPAAVVKIIDGPEFVPGDESSAFIGLREPVASLGLTRICRSREEYAADLYEFFRECDRQGMRTIYCERVPEDGIGAALMDRITRAAKG